MACGKVEADLNNGLKDHYRTAILIRAVEERLLSLFSRRLLFGTVHTCIGQEWTGIALAAALDKADYVVSNHRCHGHFLARTDNVEGLIAELMGRQTGVCGGRGGSQHLCQSGFFSNGIQGGIMPVAAGLALSQKLHNSRNLTVVFIGDGTLGEGAVYETLNCAARWALPLLVVLENNRYSQSTRQEQTLAGSITDRAKAFGIPAFVESTWNPEQLLQTAESCARQIRTTGGPVFLQIDTDRLMAHSKGDDDRSAAELEPCRRRDPIHRFQELFPDVAEEFRRDAEARIDRAVQSADAAPLASLADIHQKCGASAAVGWHRATAGPAERCVDRIRTFLHEALQTDDRMILLGEDIESPYGGAFKVTQGLSTLFPGRVRNCPISEALIAGLGNGLALAGMRPVCEIMFGDFLTLTMDQIVNHACKFRFMYNDQVRVPLIIRTPMGGRRGYGPTHSQSLEKHFFGVPGLTVLAISHRIDPALVYNQLHESIEGPALVIENKILYGQRIPDQVPDGFQLEYSDETLPAVRLRPEGPADITVVCYGEMLREVEQAILAAFDEQEIICDVICPTQLCPLSISGIAESAQLSGRLLVVEEGTAAFGFGAEVAAGVAERTGVRKIRRLSAPDLPIPACAPLEQQMLPGKQVILAALSEMMSHG